VHYPLDMNAIDLLREQHQEVKELFEQFEQAEDPEEKESLFQQLADNLAAHATIEEKIFYPAAYAKKTKELLTEAVEEHLAMKRLVADLLDMTPDDENFTAKMTVLREQVEHHVEEEEGELFAAVKQDLQPEELEALGAEMEELFETEMDEEPSESVPEQTSEAAPLK
jgi:hemerythrin-like domain-containing protein